MLCRCGGLGHRPTLTRCDALIDPAQDDLSIAQSPWSQGESPVLCLLIVQGGGHVWPGGTRAHRQANATDDIKATAEILRFFDQVS